MNWPTEIFSAFSNALDIHTVPDSTKNDAVQYLLDETARRAVWRAKADPKELEMAYCTPYTPLGSVSVGGMGSTARSVIIKTTAWKDAVDLLYTFVARNPQLICDQFKDQQVAYNDRV